MDIWCKGCGELTTPPRCRMCGRPTSTLLGCAWDKGANGYHSGEPFDKPPYKRKALIDAWEAGYIYELDLDEFGSII